MWGPATPLVGDSAVIVGATVTVNGTPLLASPPTVTTTFPVGAPRGTGTGRRVVGRAEVRPGYRHVGPRHPARRRQHGDRRRHRDREGHAVARESTDRHDDVP